MSHIKHYVRRAKAGVGMVIVEHAYIRRDGRVNERQLGIHDDALIPGLRRLAEAIKACDTVVGIQITHGGGKVHPGRGRDPAARAVRWLGARRHGGSPRADAGRNRGGRAGLRGGGSPGSGGRL